MTSRFARILLCGSVLASCSVVAHAQPALPTPTFGAFNASQLTLSGGLYAQNAFVAYNAYAQQGLFGDYAGYLAGNSWAYSYPQAAYGQHGGVVSVSVSGQSAFTGFTRCSDSNVSGGQSCVVFNGFLNNNNSSQVQTGYIGYLEARRAAGAGTTQGLEINVTNQGSEVDGTPYNMTPTGASFPYWASSGRTDVAGGRVNNTLAFGIVNNGSQFLKGIEFGFDSIKPGLVGPEPLALPTGYALVWHSSTDYVPNFFIRSDDATSGTSGQQAIIAGSTGLYFQVRTGNFPLVVTPSGLVTGGIAASGTLSLNGQFQVATQAAGMTVMKLGPSNLVSWANSSGTYVANIRSDITRTSSGDAFVFTNNGASILGPDGVSIADFSTPGVSIGSRLTVNNGITATNLVQAGSDAAAAAAGVPVNGFYINNSVVMWRTS